VLLKASWKWLFFCRLLHLWWLQSYLQLNSTCCSCNDGWWLARACVCGRDVMCGMLHCEHLGEKLLFWKEALAFTMPEAWVLINNTRHDCKGAILDVGLYMPDPGMVPDGALCGHDHVCTTLCALNMYTSSSDGSNDDSNNDGYLFSLMYSDDAELQTWLTRVWKIREHRVACSCVTLRKNIIAVHY